MTLIGKIPENWSPAIFAGLDLVDLPPLVSVASPKDYAKHPCYAFARTCNGDGDHAGITDNYKASVYGPVCGVISEIGLGQIANLTGLMLFGDKIPAAARGYLVVCETSYGGQPTIGALSSPSITAGIKAAWHDPVTPVINILPMAMPIDTSRPPSVTPWAMSVNGYSNSTAPYQAHAIVCASTLRDSVRRDLKVNGELCDTIMQCLEAGLSAIGLKRFGAIWPTLESLSAADHITYARAYAVFANAIGGDVVPAPVPVPVDQFKTWRASRPDLAKYSDDVMRPIFDFNNPPT